MDVLYFLKERTKFIRYFYETASAPFRDVIRKIEAGEAPYKPPYSEDDEPPYLEEWSEANTAIEMLGRTCVSMLSASLLLYFKTWESKLGVECNPGERKKVFENGFLAGYRRYFGKVLNLSWDDCPVKFDILEQVTLARNRDQHPEHITTMSVKHDRKKYRNLFFISESDKKVFADSVMAGISWMGPAVHVSSETLLAASEQVEMLGEWLEQRMFAAMRQSPS